MTKGHDLPLLQLRLPEVGSLTMKTVLITLLKIVVVVAVALLVYELFPLLILPLVVLGTTMLLFGGVLSSGLLILAVACMGVIAAFGVGFLALLGLLSPVWLPVLALIGLAALLRGRTGNTA